VIVGLLLGSFCKQWFTKSLNDLSHLSCFDNYGGYSFNMHKITFIAGSSEYGASPWANSIAVMPTDHMSAAKSCPDYSITSGAIQQGEPTKVFLF
jgi:hypothetical protein